MPLIYRLRPSILLLVCVIGLITGCQPTLTAYPDISETELSQATEEQRQLSSEHLLEKRHKKRKRLLKYEQRLLDVGEKIAREAIALCDHLNREKSLCLYEFNLVESHIFDFNAWADGKQVYMTDAMVRFLKEDSELAFVLAHEIAHNMMRHNRVAQISSTIGSILGALADEIVYDYGGFGTGRAFERAGGDTGFRYYSPDMEREADYIGVYLTARAGYPLEPLKYLWQRMSNLDTDAIYIETTHPTNPERAASLQKAIDEIRRKQQQGISLIPNVTKSTVIQN